MLFRLDEGSGGVLFDPTSHHGGQSIFFVTTWLKHDVPTFTVSVVLAAG